MSRANPPPQPPVSRCSQRYTPCHVPSARPPFDTGMFKEAPTMVLWRMGSARERGKNRTRKRVRRTRTPAGVRWVGGGVDIVGSRPKLGSPQPRKQCDYTIERIADASLEKGPADPREKATRGLGVAKQNSSRDLELCSSLLPRPHTLTCPVISSGPSSVCRNMVLCHFTGTISGRGGGAGGEGHVQAQAKRFLKC